VGDNGIFRVLSRDRSLFRLQNSRRLLKKEKIEIII
jgi:hypothetical protein